MNEDDFKRHFGVVLKQTRNSSGLTQQELEDATGVQRGYISDLERGVKGISLYKLFQICQGFERTTFAEFSQELAKRLKNYEDIQ